MKQRLKQKNLKGEMMNNVLMGASWCAPCGRVKRFLKDRGVGYDYVDIDDDNGLKLARDLGIRSVPSMSIDGTIVTGEKEIMEAFGE